MSNQQMLTVSPELRSQVLAARNAIVNSRETSPTPENRAASLAALQRVVDHGSSGTHLSADDQEQCARTFAVYAKHLDDDAWCRLVLFGAQPDVLPLKPAEMESINGGIIPVILVALAAPATGTQIAAAGIALVAWCFSLSSTTL